MRRIPDGFPIHWIYHCLTLPDPCWRNSMEPNRSIPAARRLIVRTALRVGLLGLLVASAQSVQAGCDNIPTAIDESRAAEGAITSPFAQPGQLLQVRVRPQICDDTSLGLNVNPADATSPCRLPEDVRVTLIFTPGNGAPTNGAVLANDCSVVQPQVDAWASDLAPAGGTAVCFDESHPTEAPGLEIVRVELGGGVAECRLNFRFPTAHGLSAPSADSVLSGPAKIVVDPVAGALLTDLATQRCADTVESASTIACIDELYAADGTCFKEFANLARRFSSFTALPPANDFAAMCTAEPGSVNSPCLGLQPAVRFTTDASGNVLAPIDWSGVLFDGPVEEFPPPLLVSTLFDVGSGLPTPPGPTISIPESGFLSSHTRSGKELPPIFDPLSDTTQALSLFGSTDAQSTVIRVQARSGQECIDSGGSRTGVPCLTDAACGTGATCGASVCADAPAQSCTSDADCSGSCGPALFDLAYLTAGPGPGIIAAGSYGAGTDGFVPLDALNVCRSGDSGLSCILRDEVLSAASQNADADALDPAVLTLRDKLSGAGLPIGFGGADGLAATLLHESPPSVGPFAGKLPGPSVRPIIAGADACVALLVAEPWENAPDLEGTDTTGDGEVFGSDVRVFCRQADGSIDEVAGDAAGFDAPLAASASPLIRHTPATQSMIQGGGEPLVLADEGSLVYFLLDEGAGTPKADLRIDVDAEGLPGDGPASEPIISQDRTTVCFASEADNLAGSRDKNRGGPDVFCRDLDTGLLEVVNRFQEPPKRRPLCEGRIIRANAPAFGASVDATGRRICYESAASNLRKGDRNKLSDVFVIDRISCETTMVSLAADGSASDAVSGGCAMSASGEWVAFQSDAQLVPADTDALTDAYLRNVDDGGLTLLSQGLDGAVTGVSLALDAGVVAVELLAGPDPEIVLLEGAPGSWSELVRFLGSNPQLDRQAIQMTFEIGGETALVDLESGFVEPVAQTSTLEDIAAPSRDASLGSNDVAFVSPTALTPGDSGVGDDAHVRDLTTRFLKRVPGASEPSLSVDGSSLVYVASTPTGPGVFLNGDDPQVVPADFDQNGATGDVVLAALDLSGAPTIEIYGSTSQVAVAGRTAVYLTNAAAPHAIVRRLACTDGSCSALDADLGPASAVSTSEELTCVLRGADDRIACGEPGSALVDLVDAAGNPTPASALAVSGRIAVYTAVDAVGDQRLVVQESLGAGVFQIQYVGQPGTRRFVVSSNGFVAADRCEFDISEDLNGDGIEDECILEMVDGHTGELFEPLTSVLPCTNDACDRKFPWRMFASGEDNTTATARILTRECQECGSCSETPRAVEACCDLDQDGSCEGIIVQEIDFQDRRFVLAAVAGNATSDPLAGPESGQGGSDSGAVIPALIGHCESDPEFACQTDANCPREIDACVDLAPAVLALSDSDGDGIFDGFDNCQFTFNPNQSNGDGDGAGDECDLFSCGDGTEDLFEYCDDGAANGTAGSFCTAECTPVVRASVSESAVNPDQQGGLPLALLGSPVLNLSASPVGDRPEMMIDPASIRFEGIGAGEECGDRTGVTRHDITDPGVYDAHVTDADGDLVLDLALHADVPSTEIVLSDTDLCITGDFRTIEGRFRPASFEVRGPMNVK
jgi:hypothetical protein